MYIIYLFCVENKTEVTRKHVHLRPSGNGSLVFINDFIVDCIYIIHTHTYIHTYTQASDPIRSCSCLCSANLPIYGPQLHDVMAALKIKTNTDRLPASAFLKHTPLTYSQREKRKHTHRDSGTHMSWVEADVNLLKRSMTARIISRLVHGDWFCEKKNGLLNPQQTEEQRLHVCTSVFSKRKQHSSCFNRLMKFKNSCVSECTDPKTTSSSPRAHDWSNGQRLGQICSYHWGICPAHLQIADIWGYISRKTGCGHMSGSHGWKMFRL